MIACLDRRAAYAPPIQLRRMRFLRPLPLLAVAALALTGCQSAERKLARGITNLTEPIRLGEMNRSVEQSTLFDGPGGGTRGAIHGFNRTIGRTVVGAFEVLTFPLPSDPYVFPDTKVYPDSYKPAALDNSILRPETSMGMSGGDIAPMIPGSRFRVFDY
jgi:putative exosortase-associated protein (TIGR04073 family)